METEGWLPYPHQPAIGFYSGKGIITLQSRGLSLSEQFM